MGDKIPMGGGGVHCSIGQSHIGDCMISYNISCGKILEVRSNYLVSRLSLN